MAADGRFADLVGCRLPIQLASLGGPIGTPALAAAVSETGGLGMLPNPSSAAEVERLVADTRALTTKPIGIGFLVPFVVREAVQAAAAAAEVIEFFYGDPDSDLVGIARGGGAVVGWQTGSAAESLLAVETGCDFVAVQGIEAGGHVRGVQFLDEVLAETLARVDAPVVAAGGVGSPERVAALLEAGASAVRVGTRFVAAEESDAHPEYIARLIAASRQDTLLTDSYGVDWPNAPHRVLRNAVEAARQLDASVAATLGDREIPRFASMPPTRQVQGHISAMALYAGESVDAVTHIQPARDIVAELLANV